MQHMSLLVEIFRGIFFLAVLAISSEFLAKGAEILEKKFGAGFVGSVILGFVTMLPELVFVLVAVRAGESDVAVGSAVGGNILLFTIGLGLVILLALWKHGEMIQLSHLMRDDFFYLFASSLFLIFAALDGSFGIVDGVILVIMYLAFIGHQYWETKKYPAGTHPKDAKQPDVGHKDEIESKTLKYIVFFIIGTFGILWAAEPFVESIVQISHETGIPALFLSLVISPLASEMPEKISALILTLNSMTGAEMAVANFVGSKIQANTLLFGGMVLYFISLNGVALVISSVFLDIMVAIITTLVGTYVLLDLKLKKSEGILISFLYLVAVTVVYFT